MKPLVFDLYCGLGGWSDAFIDQGYRAIGFDIETHDYGSGSYPGELILCDVRSISGTDLVERFGIPSVIVASPPCQEFSYMAMPWSKAKEKLRKIISNPKEQLRLTELFNESFRIQREVSEAAGRYVPIIIENVRGAQKWVGKSRWHFGSFHLWGDVPALMPIEGNFKSHGPNWCDQMKRLCDADLKKRDEDGYDYNGRTFGWKAPKTSSKSNRRKEASAQIAKIPPALASWIAKCFKPKCVNTTEVL